MHRTFIWSLCLSPLFQENKARAVRQFHFHGWPEVGIPTDGKGMINLIAAVQKQQQQSGNHPITVHCRWGPSACCFLTWSKTMKACYDTVIFMFCFDLLLLPSLPLRLFHTVLVLVEQGPSVRWVRSWRGWRQRASWMYFRQSRASDCRGPTWCRHWWGLLWCCFHLSKQ